ncbi:hypothetical protein Cni_G12670 [Canna indica]|uniref:NAC domain-containing protein n=1 Tax=Canna indica TaxID=4628 RepID=A0AAQ3KAA3_9LILI|nr:hypothetical protein Cni_G12670 [Canna indica]
MSSPLTVSMQFDINKHLTDEEVILSLGRGRIGYLVLSTVNTGVDPFNIEPPKFPEELWYWYKSGNLNKRSLITETKSGFWKTKNDYRIFTNANCIGRKTTMEFYRGKVPFGNITRWMMHEYRAEQESPGGSNIEKEYNSFCRVFMQNDQIDYAEKQYSASVIASSESVVQLLPMFYKPEQLPSKDALNRFLGQLAFSESLDEQVNQNILEKIHETCDFLIGDYLELNDFCDPNTFAGRITVSVDKQGQLSLNESLGEPLSMNVQNNIYLDESYLEINDLCNPEASPGLWTVSVDEQQQSSFCGNLTKTLNESILKDIDATNDFSDGDYLEVNDLCSRETSSSSSDNSSRMSVNSYDYFDADALLSIGDEGNLRAEGLLDHRFSISTVAESSQVVIRPPQSGSVHSNSNISSLPGNGFQCRGLSISDDELKCKKTDSKAGNSEGSPSTAGFSRGSRSIQYNGLKSIGKIAKLGKKYCCFV